MQSLIFDELLFINLTVKNDEVGKNVP